MLSRIQAALRSSIAESSERIGPFCVHIDRASDNPFRNYAVPDDDARPDAGAMSGLIEFFAWNGRRPRIEFVAPAPGVDQAAESAGFRLEADLPIMTVERSGLQPARSVAGLQVGVAGTPAEWAEVAAVQNTAYGEGEPTQADIDRLASTVERGGQVVLARLDGVPAGAGLFAPPANGLTEIAAVGVLPQFRRRGIASVVGHALSDAAFEAGLTPFLQTETVNENRLYGQLGYETVGSLRAVIRP